MRVSDYIANKLRTLGCTEVFMVTGGAAMHLNDSFGKIFKNSVHTLHHEQSCSIAAEGYARVTGKPAVVNCTAGPGAINTINGVFGAYVDSIPMIIISGQAKRETMMRTYELPGLRQLGDQEVDIATMVKGICKSVKVLDEPLDVEKVINEMYVMSMGGRQGPVWIDVPIDVQSYQLPDNYGSKEKDKETYSYYNIQKKNPKATEYEVEELARMIIEAKRPILYVGSGIRSSRSYDELLTFLENWKIPTVTGWNSNDLLWDSHESYAGRPGSVGNRAGNFAVQYSDCVIVLGCRLNIRQVSFNWNSFAKNAKIAQVDIDRAELDKPTLRTDMKIESDLKGFLPALDNKLNEFMTDGDVKRISFHSKIANWKNFNKKNLETYKVSNDTLPTKEIGVNPYRLIEQYSKRLGENTITICADGTACVVGFQASIIKQGQRLFHNSGCASMGYELPAAIGAYYASMKTIHCIAGDGSIMMNIQELAYIGGFNLPIKILLLNNKGYHSIRQTQNNYFPDNPVGCGIESGLPFPNFQKLSDSCGINYMKLSSEKNMDEMLDLFHRTDGPRILEVELDLEQQFAPKLASKKLASGKMVTAELEDMTPLLGDDILKKIEEEAFNINR